MIRFDRYTDDRWSSVPAEDRARVKAAIPEGLRLHVGHGGNRYTATLWRDSDNEIVARESRSRIVEACFAALARYEVVVTVGADGYIRSFEDAS